MKKLIAMVLIVVGALIIYKYISGKMEPVAEPGDPLFSARLKQLGSHAPIQELSTSPAVTQNPSQEDLIGVSHNPYGLRDDILVLILQSIPESDVRSTLAAIKMAQFDQAQIGVTNQLHLNELANKAAAASYCMQLPLEARSEFGKNYDHLLRNTPQRLAEQDRIESMLSEQIIAPDFGVNSYDRNQQCNHFLGLKQ